MLEKGYAQGVMSSAEYLKQVRAAGPLGGRGRWGCVGLCALCWEPARCCITPCPA